MQAYCFRFVRSLIISGIFILLMPVVAYALTAPVPCIEQGGPCYRETTMPLLPSLVNLFGIVGLCILLVNLISIYLITKYLSFRKLKNIIWTSILGTIIGIIIDIILFFVSAILTSPYISSGYSLTIKPFIVNPNVNSSSFSMPNLLFYFLLFLMSFALLWTMYYLLLQWQFHVVNKRKVTIVSVVLALVTNPIWYFAILSIF
jgi:hypothetical protein